MEIRRLAMRQSGGLSLARPMPDCLHQKHLALCRTANSLAPRARLQYFCSAKMQTNASGSPKSSREAAFLRARWRFEDLQCDSPADCRSRDRCRIACIKSIWQFAGLQTALRPRARLQYFCSAKMQTNANGSPKSSEINRFPSFFLLFSAAKIRVLKPRFFVLVTC